MKLSQTPFTASELGEMRFDPLRYVCRPIIVPGSTLLAGKPKVNKTWLMQEVALSAATGGAACGEWQCEDGDVLFFALEDNKRRLHRRLSMLRPKGAWPDTLEFQTNAARLGNGFEDQVRRWHGRVSRPCLVVVDTYNFIRPIRSNDRISYQTDYFEAAALTALAEELSVAIVAIHHMRKMEAEDPLDAISGTTGIAAGFDTIFAMSRTQEGLIKIEGRGRDIIPVEVALNFDTDTARWTIAGDPVLAAASDQRKAILHYLQTAGEAGPKEIAERTGVSHEVVRKLVGLMVESGLIRKSSRGSYAPLHNGHNVHNGTGL